jgi:hypothetical protein
MPLGCVIASGLPGERGDGLFLAVALARKFHAAPSAIIAHHFVERFLDGLAAATLTAFAGEHFLQGEHVARVEMPPICILPLRLPVMESSLKACARMSPHLSPCRVILKVARLTKL